ncbi:hypothetical protein ZIOFF_035542 [Zingiber officinale]|uniref:heme oxygenase (biliverdin-producing) n=1 Tax=Zingiber officinale TaxID=94328 RepID=A0A8J5L7V0_ZINOF|nr:hypothetical protein ZIOFF_035542 [Zingiber officinale]
MSWNRPQEKGAQTSWLHCCCCCPVAVTAAWDRRRKSSGRSISMASSTLPISQSQAFCARARLIPASLSGPVHFALPHRHRRDASYRKPLRTMVVTATTAEMPKKRQASRDRSFVDEMWTVAMRLHTKDQAKEGEKESKSPPVAKWEPSIEGYLRFLVDSKIVYDTLETIIQKAAYPWYAEFRSTGLERSEKLAKDLKWFKDQGHTIPEPSSPGVSYSQYLDELSQKDPQAFICHFYNIYFAHSAGGRMIGKKVLNFSLNVIFQIVTS